MENTLAEIADAMENGRCKKVRDLVRLAIREGYSADQVLERGLLKAMENVSRRFQREVVEMPEILAITRALNGGMTELKELYESEKTEYAGTVLIGTMRGDVHDIGKNLVRIMLESKGMKVIDLGVGVAAHRFVDAALSEGADVVVCSGFLRESVTDMQRMIGEFEARGMREDVYIMVGGAALNDVRAKRIGADCYTEDASGCSEKAYTYCKRKKRKKERYVKTIRSTHLFGTEE